MSSRQASLQRGGTAVHLAPGKWQRLGSLTDEEGRFFMLALDQRDSLRRALGAALGISPDAVAADHLTGFKQAVTKTLAPYATAILLDPEYGYPHVIEHLPPGVGLLLCLEESGHEKAGPGGRERKTRLLNNFSVEKAQQLGADAIKLLVYYNPDASAEVRRHQQEIVRQAGGACARAGLPFLLELVSYAIEEAGTDTAEYARRKPDLVARSAAEFSKPEYQVDIFKLEFPADLKWTQEYANGAFDGKVREPVYSLAEVRERCRRLDQVTDGPWVILSAGVTIEEFLVQVDLATEAGASGFLCGRAIWKDAAPLFRDQVAMEEWLDTKGVYNSLRANAHAQLALPWMEHRL